jgi:hypothetical protein
VSQELRHWSAVVFTVAALIGVPLLFSGEAVGLAWQSGNEAIQLACQVAKVKLGQITAPNRARLQERRFHPLQENARGKTFPFATQRNSTGDADASESGLESKLKHPDARAEARNSEGTIHILHSLKI